ncbi:MAG: hypothetical protein AAF936_12735 [Pseudomonadota bacterium]
MTNRDNDDTTASIEGKLVKKSDDYVLIEIQDGLRVRMSSKESLDLVEEGENDDSEPWVRLSVKKGQKINLEVVGELLLAATNSRQAPFVFAEGGGLSFAGLDNAGSTPNDQPPDGTVLKAAAGAIGPIGGADFGGGGMNYYNTRSIFQTCRRHTRSIWGITCDFSIGDINYPDD